MSLFIGKNKNFAHLLNANITSDFCLSKKFRRFFNKFLTICNIIKFYAENMRLGGGGGMGRTFSALWGFIYSLYHDKTIFPVSVVRGSHPLAEIYPFVCANIYLVKHRLDKSKLSPYWLQPHHCDSVPKR